MPAPAVVVPCFNEEERLDQDAILGLVDDGELRLVLVDDGSTDGTAGILASLAERSPSVSVLTLPRNAGKAEAVRQGLLRAIDNGATLVAYYDADLSTPPDELRRLVAILGESPELDVVMASRVRLLGRDIERRPMRHYLGRVFATFASLSLALPVYDTQCGAKALRVTDALRSALRSRFRSHWVFDVELIGRLLYPSEGVSATAPVGIVEIPLRRWHDVAGSKLRATDGFRAALELATIALAIRRRPSFQRARRA